MTDRIARRKKRLQPGALAYLHGYSSKIARVIRTDHDEVYLDWGYEKAWYPIDEVRVVPRVR